MTLSRKVTQPAAIVGLLCPIYAMAANIVEPDQPQIPPSVLASIWSTCSGGKYEQDPAESIINLITGLHTATPRETNCVNLLKHRYQVSHADQAYFKSNATDELFRATAEYSPQQTDIIANGSATNNLAPLQVTDSVVIKPRNETLPTLNSFETQTASDLK
jgi:hypothetical protein